MLFSDRSLWTMLHGVVLGGGVLMALAAALFGLVLLRAGDRPAAATDRQSGTLAWVTTAVAVILWLTVLIGTYIIFPPYRTPPPEGTVDLARYPRAALLANPDTAWLHAFAMECKEHMPWIASMLATAVAFVSVRYRSALVNDARLRQMAFILLAVTFLLASFAGLLGTFVNKVAPLE